MANYFKLKLDTTAPTVQIVAPYTSIQNNVIRIDVIANEELNSFQDIYLVDSAGNKHAYTFYKYKDNEYIGYIDLQYYPLGIATIYATVSDVVGNASIQVFKTFLIGEIEGEIAGYMEVTQSNILIKNNDIASKLYTIGNKCDVSIIVTK